MNMIRMHNEKNLLYLALAFSVRVYVRKKVYTEKLIKAIV